jgi:o-succinylbenzoate synthase
MDAAVAPFDLALDPPLSTADGDLTGRRGWLVRVSDGDAAGVGEATPLPGWTESRAACGRALAGALDTLREAGADPALAELRGAPAARHGLHLALSDLAARRAGTPLAAHLGGADPPASVPVNATVGDADAGATASAAADAVDAGFDCVKVKVGARDAAADTARLQAVRAAVGDDVVLRADANGAWTRAQAYEAVRNYPAAGVAAVEQPLDPADIAGAAGLRGDGVAVALDESVRDAGVAAVLDADAADAVVVKPMALGGVDRARAAAVDALERGVGVVVSNTVDAAVARAAAGHLAASLPARTADDGFGPSGAAAVGRFHGLATGDRLADDVGPPPAVADGRLELPDGPGHGVAVDPDDWRAAPEVGDRA